MALRSPTRWPGGWWCRRTATAVRRQYVERPVPTECEHDLADLLPWMAEHLDQELTVSGLARRAHMSERTFARRFRAETGTTPHHWLTWQRVLLAQRLLESTELDVDQIARRCGFGGAATLRHHFVGPGRHLAAAVPSDVPPGGVNTDHPQGREQPCSVSTPSPSC
jgi:transcriptional regulator GlxA family with amidase domain